MEIPQGYANVRFVFSVSGNTREMSWALGCAPPAGMSAEEIAIAAASAILLADLVTPSLIQTGWTYLGTRVALAGIEGPLLGESNAAVIGSASGGAVPPNCSLLIRKVTGSGGRKNRGRAFVPPYMLGELGVNNNGTLDVSVQTGMTDRYQDLLGAFTASELLPRLFHSSPADTPNAITAMVCQSQIATQRRRLR